MKVIILKHQADYKFQPEDNFRYFSVDIEVPEIYSVYQTPKSITNHVNSKFDF